MRYTETTHDAEGEPGGVRYMCWLGPCPWAVDFWLDEGESFAMDDCAHEVDTVLRAHLDKSHTGWSIDDLRTMAVRARAAMGGDAYELAWWRQFATHCLPAAAPPPVGTPLLGHTFEVHVLDEHGEQRSWNARRG